MGSDGRTVAHTIDRRLAGGCVRDGEVTTVDRDPRGRRDRPRRTTEGQGAVVDRGDASVEVVPSEGQSAESVLRETPSRRHRGSGHRQRIGRGGDLDRGGRAVIDREVPIRASSGTRVLQGAVVKDKVGRRIGSLAKVARDSTIADRRHTDHARADRGHARVGVAASEGQRAAARMGQRHIASPTPISDDAGDRGWSGAGDCQGLNARTRGTGDIATEAQPREGVVCEGEGLRRAVIAQHEAGIEGLAVQDGAIDGNRTAVVDGQRLATRRAGADLVICRTGRVESDRADGDAAAEVKVGEAIAHAVERGSVAGAGGRGTPVGPGGPDRIGGAVPSGRGPSRRLHGE